MAEYTALLLILCAAIVAMFNWRLGLLFCIVVGFIQDPLRKLLPPHPGYFIILVGVAFSLVYLAAWLIRKEPLRLSYLYVGDKRMSLVWKIFIALVILQSLNVLLRYGNVILAVFGAIMYLGPMFALMLVYAYADSVSRILKFLHFYTIFGIVAGISVYFSYWMGSDWPVLWEIGTFFGRDLIIYDVGTALSSYSGLLRVGEIAAWHAATTICFLVILASVRGSLLYRLWVALICTLLVGAIILTGRRKMLLALVIFGSVYWFLLVLLGRGALKLGLAILLIGSSIAVLGNLLFNDSGQQLYLERGTTVFSTESISERLNTSLSLLTSAYYRAGFIGFGTGVASQGARFTGTNTMSDVGGAGEAGIGRIVLEFGVLGAIVLVWFSFRLAKYFWRLLKYIQVNNSRLGMISFGLIAFLTANVATFAVATQLYGDFFVLLMLGIVMGFLFAMPKLVYQQNLAKPMIKHSNI